MAVVTHTRRFVFQSIHHLPLVMEGKHGHHFYLELTYRNTISPETVTDSFRDWIEPYLHGQEVKIVSPPTGEKIVDWIHSELRKSPLGPHLLGVILQETDKNRYISSQTEARFV